MLDFYKESKFVDDSWWTLVYDNPLALASSVWRPVYRLSTGSAGFFITESFHKTRSDLSAEHKTQSVQRQQIPPVSRRSPAGGPGRLCFHGVHSAWPGPRTAQAIRLFQGYALIMEWAAYRDSRKADWEQIGRGKTSRISAVVCPPIYLIYQNDWKGKTKNNIRTKLTEHCGDSLLMVNILLIQTWFCEHVGRAWSPEMVAELRSLSNLSLSLSAPGGAHWAGNNLPAPRWPLSCYTNKRILFFWLRLIEK